jgi:hypothetical protein
VPNNNSNNILLVFAHQLAGLGGTGYGYEEKKQYQTGHLMDKRGAWQNS